MGRARSKPLSASSAPHDTGPAAPVAGIAGPVLASPITRAIRVLGDRWSLLVIRDAFQGVRRFEQFLTRSGGSRATLTRRLRALVQAGVLERVRYSASPPRFEYRLAASGRDLYPLSLFAWDWERRWAPRGAGIPLKLQHDRCGAPLRAVTACAGCGRPLHLRDVELEPRPGVAAPTRQRRGRLRRLSALTSASNRGTQQSLTHVADLVGDPWTPLLLAAAFFGVRRFDDFQRELGIASNILAARLDLLVRRKVFVRRPYQRQPLRHEYRLTGKGLDLFPYAILLEAWGERWLGMRGNAPYVFIHRPCGRQAIGRVQCAACGESLRPGSVGPRTATAGA